MKKCPFCAEEIQDEAIVCKHCGRDLNASAKPVVGSAQEPVRMIDQGRRNAWQIIGILFLIVLLAVCVVSQMAK